MEEKPLILVGGGGHCKSVIEAVESTGRKIKGIFDLPKYLGEDCLGYKVIGTDSDISRYTDECEFIVTLGFITTPERRIRLHNIIEEAGGKFGIVVASSAQVSMHAEVASGSVVLHNATINAGARIGKGCIINTCANIEHDSWIGDYAHVSTGAMVNGDCRIGNATFIGSGSVIVNGVLITDNVIVGAGAVVCADISEKGTYVGIPAKKIY